MRRGATRRLAASVLAVTAALALATPAPAASGDPDCDGPPPDARPGTPEWDRREADNVFCGEQRSRDTAANPAFSAAAAEVQARHGGPVPVDPFRDPAVLDGLRFRYEEVSFANAEGDPRAGMLFRPCDRSCRDRPATLGAHRPPYPAVLIIHGGAASQEMYMWGAQALAEAGYMVLTFQVPTSENTGGGDAHYEDGKAALDFLLSSPGAAARGLNPHWTEVDRDHVGVAGHSAGGVAVSRIGQEDPRVSAIVSWDRAQSSPMPADLALRTPALFVVADFNCQRVPVCLPEPYPEPPDPRGPGNKDTDFQRVSEAGIDSMKIALRAATHLDFTEFAPTPPSSRYGAIVTSYYTLAWFDRYLKGSAEALARLVGTGFDDSADVHYTSGGSFDPATQRNVPARIAGQRVVDRLSFHFRSAYFLERGALRCDDIRAGCPAAPAPSGADRRCARPRFRPRVLTVRRSRTGVRPRVRCGGRNRSVVVRLRVGSRRVHVVSGRRVRVRIPAAQRRIPARFAVDGRRHRAEIRIRRPDTRAPRFAG